MVKRGILNSDLPNRTTVTLKSLLAFCRLTCIINLVSMWPHCAVAQCAEVDTLISSAEECFQPYGTQKLYVDRSEQKLFSGIDIEILRAYCSSYLESMHCVSTLISSCPPSSRKQVEDALVNYSGIQKELTDLCTTSGLYELYAQYMTCYSKLGEKSEKCYRSKLNNTVPNIYTPPTEQFCSQVREATLCIENNIREACGEQAKELVHLLVKPTVVGSAQCIYNIVDEKTPQTMKTVDSGGRSSKPKERATSSQSHDTHSSATTSSTNFILLFFSICVSYTCIAYLFKPQGIS
ncbi:uncharacterized protein LOC132737412 [Ruditapes philippinarum]|uniref:uncharacterized protein LOC132737412 n=1 Tax=Ruditapes philippinarum TaxID=129788 RepID=UPI00295ADE8B|nr:uncharacterized protein LOC132737412 [Ruditapes philippinarum]